MPFREEIFDAVMCGYSLRDAIQLKQAISEMHRVLKVGGRLIIVDLGKPDGALQRALVSAYLKYFLGIFAFLVAGRAGLPFRTLYGTFLRWPRNSELEGMLKERFSKVDFEKDMMGGAVIIRSVQVGHDEPRCSPCCYLRRNRRGLIWHVLSLSSSIFS